MLGESRQIVDRVNTAEELSRRDRLAPRGQPKAWLRIYLGYAPGVGKTYAMLHEAQRRRERGTDVVVGWVETYGRVRTIEAIGDLEVIPRQWIEHRGTWIEEMDVEAIIARRPQVVLIDELAHANIPGSTHQKRYQDVLRIRDAGINVITTLSIEQIDRLKETIEQVTGVRVQETVPDWVIAEADEVELIDITPEALQKRLLHGNIYPLDRVQEALGHTFRRDTLAALRELALRRVLEHTDSRLPTYLQIQGSAETWREHETVLVCVPSGIPTQHLVRRGAHLAGCLKARFVVLHVVQPGRHQGPEHPRMDQEAQKALQLARQLGADVCIRQASDVGATIAAFATGINATQIILGESTRSWLRELLKGSITREVLSRTKDVDIHIVQRTDV